MKFFIDGKEIKTVISGATISGSLNLVSRCASFSYIYSPIDKEFEIYKAKIGSLVLIKNESKNIFQGKITSINYQAESKVIQIQAKDLFSILLETKPIGRFKGNLLNVLKQVLDKNNIIPVVNNFIKNEINIVNFGELTSFDVIKIAINKVYGDDFKLFLDGDLNLNILFPLISNSKADFIIGENIISSNFSSSKIGNTSIITAIGNNEIVSGSVIRVIEPNNGFFGYFVVQKDRHVYSLGHIMELEIKERISI